MQIYAHRDLASLANALYADAPDRKTGSMFEELEARWSRQPDTPVEPREVYAQALRMANFGHDARAKARLGRAALEFLSHHTACQVACAWGLQVAAAVTTYDAEWAVFRGVLQQPEVSDSVQLANLALGVMEATARNPQDQSKVGEAACQALGQHQVLQQTNRTTTYNQDGRIFQAALTAVASAPPAPLGGTGEDSRVARLSRVPGPVAATREAEEILKEAGTPLARLGLELMDRARVYRVCHAIGQTFVAALDAGQEDPLAVCRQALDELASGSFRNCPIDRGVVAAAALSHFKGTHEPVASLGRAAADQCATYLAQFEVARAALEALAEKLPASAAVEKMVAAAAPVHLQSASRAGQAGVEAISVLFGRPEIEERARRMAGSLAESESYNGDLELIQACLKDLAQWPEPASGSLLSMARGAEASAVGERGSGVVIGGVRLKVKRRGWEVEPPEEIQANADRTPSPSS